jgi:hypothetical protein
MFIKSDSGKNAESNRPRAPRRLPAKVSGGVAVTATLQPGGRTGRGRLNEALGGAFGAGARARRGSRAAHAAMWSVAEAESARERRQGR